MSGPGSQWAWRSSPSSKQGPIRATLPMSSLMRQNSCVNQRIPSSPTSSPTYSWKSRVSPEQNLSGIRSPGAINCRVKRKQCSGCTIRRTASLDTIYLASQWPAETLYLYAASLHIDRSTQTDELLPDNKKAHRSTEQPVEDKLDKYIKQRGEEAVWESRHRLHSSLEGLNQEIERLVLTSADVSYEAKSGLLTTPEGHRAPLAELLRQTRSVNTQTPAYSAQSSGGESRESPLAVADSRPPSESSYFGEESSPEHETKRAAGCSPRINRFLARAPPDGCLRFPDQRPRKPVVLLSEVEYPLKPSVNFQLKPSLRSAFHPLRSPLQPQTQ